MTSSAGETGRQNHNRASSAPAGVAEEQVFPGFDALYARTLDRVYAYVRVRTSNDEEAADLTQQIYLLALKGWKRRPDAVDALLPWLFRIARNAATDLYRRRRPTVAWEDVPEEWQPLTEQTVETSALQHESHEHLRVLLDDLPPAKRELLALRFAAGLHYGEIGAIVGKSEAATKQQILRLLYALKDQYDER